MCSSDASKMARDIGAPSCLSRLIPQWWMPVVAWIWSGVDIVINQWLRQYNHVRPREALSMRAPVPETMQRPTN